MLLQTSCKKVALFLAMQQSDATKTACDVLVRDKTKARAGAQIIKNTAEHQWDRVK